jgi:hypothetical protein
MKNYFRVKYGYSVADQVSIEESELEKAVYAQKFGEVVQLGNKQVNGKNIIVIEPHYHRYTGWYDFYEPKNGEDYAQIERDCPKGLDLMIRHYRERVDYLITIGRRNLIGKNIFIPELEKVQSTLLEEKQKEVKEISDNITDNFKIK